MVKQINEYTMDELSKKIRAIKAKRERTANALKKYEEELKKRKQEFPLGVPLEDYTLSKQFRAYAFDFLSEDSARVFDERLKDYVKALQKLAKGEPIDIKALLPLLPKGWVVMSQSKHWLWFENKPYISVMNMWSSCIEKDGHKEYIDAEILRPFNIKPVKDWQFSLMECGL